jgi:hypothetical protein
VVLPRSRVTKAILQSHPSAPPYAIRNNSQGTKITTNDRMDVCNLSPNATIGLGLQFSNFSASRQNIAPCGQPTYLRPDPGGCLLPWPYTLAWILIHLPVTILRVRSWERVQTLSLVLATFSVYFTLQAYTTHLAADQILVWMPLAIVLDIGAMMQLVFLIVEENGILLLWLALVGSVKIAVGLGNGRRGDDGEAESQDSYPMTLNHGNYQCFAATYLCAKLIVFSRTRTKRKGSRRRALATGPPQGSRPSRQILGLHHRSGTPRHPCCPTNHRPRLRRAGPQRP